MFVVDGDRSGPDGSRFVEARQDFRNASVRDEQLARYVTRPHSEQGQLHDPPADVIRKRSTVDKHAAQLIHSGLACTIQ